MKKLMIVPVMALGMLFATNANAQVKDGMDKAETEVKAQKEYVKIETSKLPEAVTAAVAKDFKTSTISEAFKAKDNTYKLILTTETGEKGMAFIDATGKWITPSK